MTSILDQHVSIGVETTYSTPVAPTRSYEARSDDWQREVEFIESGGFRADRQTIRSDRHRTVSLGATGSIETAVFDRGMGLLLQHLLGKSVAPVQQEATAAYVSKFESDDTGPDGSYTVVVARDDFGTLHTYRYAGCVPTGFSLEASIGDPLMLAINYDSAAEDVTSAVTPAYPADAVPYVWEDCTLTIGGATARYQSFSLEGDLAMRTDLRYLKGDAVKAQPVRSGVPAYSGTIGRLGVSKADYDRFVAGTVFEAVFTAKLGTAIEGTHFPQVKVTMPACKFTGSTPQASVDDVATISLPYVALHDGTDPAVTIEITSADTAF